MIRTLLQILVINIILLIVSSCWAVFDANSFLQAADTGAIATIQTMSAEATQQDKGWALCFAAYSGHLEIVQFLLGMNVNGYRLSADQIANIHAKDDYALRMAAFNGHLAIVQFLLGMQINGHQLPADRIANIHAEDDWALKGAATRNHFAVAYFLVQHGADLGILSQEQQQAIRAYTVGRCSA